MVFAAGVVLVHLLPHAPAEEYGERLITACTQGLRQGACVLATETTAERSSAIVAEVEWEDDSFRVAVVRLGRPHGGKHEWTSGKVAFDDGDSLSDRWTTAGFTIATLAGDLTSQGEPAPASRTAEPAPVAVRPRVRPPAGERRVEARPGPKSAVRAAAGLGVGQAMRGQSPRLGPWVTAGYAPFELPLSLRLRGSVSWARGPGAEVRWSTVALGLESHLSVLEDADLVLAADGGPSLLSADSARTGHRVRASLSFYVGCEVPLAGPFSVIGGGEVTAGPTTALATTSGLVLDRRFKLGGIMGVSAKL